MFELIAKESVGKRMIEKGLTQLDMADNLGITNAWLCKIVSGKESPSRKLAKRIAELLGGETTDFFIVQDVSDKTRSVAN